MLSGLFVQYINARRQEETCTRALHAGLPVAVSSYPFRPSCSCCAAIYFFWACQAKKFWKEAILDAREVVKIEPTYSQIVKVLAFSLALDAKPLEALWAGIARRFAKGYLHLAKSLLQLGNLDEAREVLNTGTRPVIMSICDNRTNQLSVATHVRHDELCPVG